MIRKAVKNDLERITEIYNQAIISKKATADMEVFKEDQRMQWFLIHSNNERTPIYVYEDECTLAGYCSLSAYRPGRQALESIAEISYYIDYSYHRRGFGSKLVQYAIDEARKLGYKNLLAILLSCNDSSQALLKKYGFEHWGTLPNIVYINDKIYSHYYYGLKLRNCREISCNFSLSFD